MRLSSTSSLPAGRRFALASLLAGLVLVVPAVAGAQADSVGQPSDLCSDPSCDTEATPVAKPSSERDWQQIGGDIFPGATAGKYDAKSSPTRVSDDLFSVSFFRQLHGVAGGAGCIDPPTGLTGEDLSGALRDCTRGPAIYTYSQPAEGVEGTWTRAIVEGADKRGFVGAVAWISPNKALAVGGTREYPRRELGALPGEPGGPGQPPLPDPAGTARAWLFDPATYDNQVWHELDVPNDMGALTALDFSKSPDTQCGQAWRECGFAGGMRQIWPWKNGRFDPEVVYRGACPGDTSSCPTLPSKSEDARAPVIDGSDWLFRVRAIRFDPDPTYPRPATAVTSGCCNADPQKNTARWLVYYKQQPTAPASWNVSLAHQGGAVEGGETLPDGYYAIGPGPSIIASPSGPRRAIEPASRIFGPANRTLGQGGPAGAAGGYGQPQLGQPQLNTVKSPVAGDAGGTTSDLLIEAVDPRLSNVRLVAGDGDEDGPPTAITGQGLLPGWQYPDGVMDWAVGELMSTGQGVAYTTTAHRRELSEPRLLKCSPLIVPPKCDLPSADYIAQQQRSQSLFALSTYALSGYTYLPATHVGWGVGDRGALVRLAPAGSFSRDVEAAPPALGARSSANLPDSSPYDGFRAPESKHGPGLLPVLTAQAPQKVSQSQLVPAGSPNAAFGNGQTVGTIVMSRDGGEGWALGPQVDVSGSTTALFHYALGKWSNCDPLGLRAQGDTLVSPDPACADLAQLSSGSNDLSARITGAARIPYENDPNPTNDDDFSAVAAGSQVKIAASKAQGGSISAPLLLRYQNQAWRVDLQGMRDLAASPNATRGPATGIAFTRPDDGWMVVSGGVVDGNTFIFHYNGKRWTDCRSPEGSSPDGADSCHGNGLLDLPDAARMPIRMTSAGSRVYLYGARDGASGQAVLDQEAQLATQALYPLVLYKDPGGLWRSDQGGYDPKNAPGGARQDQQGAIYSLSVTKASAATYAGWALGIFGANANASAASLAAAHYTSATGRLPNPSNDPFLRLDGDQWRPFSAGAVGDEYPPTSFGQVLALPGRDLAAGPAFMTPTTDPYGPNNPMISFDPARSGWRVFPTPFSMVPRGYDPRQQGSVSALTSDNQGGVWLAASSVNDDTTWFYHYTDRPPEPVFAEVSHPIRERATVATGAADGSFWVGTDSNSLYRHDRLTGWGRVRIPGWDRGRVVINASPVYGLAFDSVGRGVAVGKGGRIADLTPTTARLDDAAGRVCAAVGSPGPCGTGHDLRTAAIGPDDSVLVGGDRRALLYRPPGGLFHSVSKPEVSISATITAISYPSEGHAWLATDSGEVFGGTLDGADWRWQRETLDASGVPLTTNKNGGQTALRAIAILPGGRGYAVGDRGLVLERTGEGPAPWQRLASDSGANLDSIAIGPGGYGLVVGGDDGLILTLERGRFEVARPGDAYDPAWASGRQGGSAQTVGIALLAGSRSGELEAWATSQGFATPTAILHYAADSGDRLLNPAARAQPLLDSGPSRQGELSFTAFGRSDCQLSTRAGAGTGDMACPEPTGSKLVNDAISQRVTKEITDSASHPDGPAFSLFSGDVDDIAGSSEGKTASAPTEMSVVHHRFAELVVDPLRQAGVPLFAALGGQDLSHAGVCPVLLQLYVCDSTHHSRIGPSLAWQQAFGSQPAPFGDGDPASRHGVSFEPVGSVAKDGNAQTHYAFDVIRDGKAAARVAVLDTSLKSLSAADGAQNPLEAQLPWLRSTLCFSGESTPGSGPCSRRVGEPAIVASNTPTYSYGPGGLSDTQGDGSSLEALLFQYRVSVVISGRLGWNGLYWATEPGLHYPCAGSAYPDPQKVPDPGVPPCAQGPAGVPDASETTTKTLGSAEQTTSGAGSSGNLTGKVVPFVVAASAGGPFGPAGTDTGRAGDGYWHGYTTVRLAADGDPRGLIVEQRPILDWLDLQAKTHVVQPNQHLALRGEGREAMGIDSSPRYDPIDSPAITHCYDLVWADQDKPWLPLKADDASDEQLAAASGAGCRQRFLDSGSASARNDSGAKTNPCDPYVCLDPAIARLTDDQQGKIEAGNGDYKRTFAIAILSVNQKVATYPISFEPRPSFTPEAPPPPPPPNGPPPPPPPPPAPNGQLPQINLPTPPVPPSVPLDAGLVAPPPPAVPPPPGASSATPLNLFLNGPGLNIAPQSTVVPPPAPPIQPAPPGGARKEARQKQAATQDSGAGTDSQGVSEAGEQGGDMANTPPGPEQSMTRRDRIAPGQSLTPLSHRGQPSAWARDLQWGGGLTLMALVLAFGWITVRPTPRRRQPELPAPAWVRSDSRRRR